MTFATTFVLPADHYFFVPQVQLFIGDFLWLSAARPIDPASGIPFPVGFTDLQSWTRDAFLEPDWLRVDQDIVDGNRFPTFNAAFSLSGSPVPEPSDLGNDADGLRRARLARSPAQAQAHAGLTREECGQGDI